MEDTVRKNIDMWSNETELEFIIYKENLKANVVDEV